jgi:hypothetical protein
MTLKMQVNCILALRIRSPQLQILSTLINLKNADSSFLRLNDQQLPLVVETATVPSGT